MDSLNEFEWDDSITPEEREEFLASLSLSKESETTTPTYPLKEERKASTEQLRASERGSMSVLEELSSLGLFK